MHAPRELVFDLFQLRPHPFRDRDALNPEPSAPGRRADVREAQEIERLRLAGPACLPVPGSVPPELDQPRLTRVQFQPELREPAAQLAQEPVGVLPFLEPDDEVVREADDDYVTVRVASPPPVSPQVQDVVQVHVREQRRYHAPNAMDNFCFDVTLSYRRLERPRRVTGGK